MGEWRSCPECGRRFFSKVVAGSAMACVFCVAGSPLPSLAGAAAQPAPAAAAARPPSAPAAAAPAPAVPADHRAGQRPDEVRITKQQPHLSPEHADPKHVEADEPTEFVPPPPFVPLTRAVRAPLMRQPRGRIYTTPLPRATPPPPPQPPPRRSPVQARLLHQIRQSRSRIVGPPFPPAQPAAPRPADAG